MIKTLIPQILLTVGTMLFISANPFVLIPVMLAGSAIHGVLRMPKVNEKIRAAIASSFRQGIEEKSSEYARDISEGVYEEFVKIENLVQDGLQKQVELLREEVEKTLAEKQRNEAALQQKRGQLVNIDKSLTRISEELIHFRSQVIDENPA